MHNKNKDTDQLFTKLALSLLRKDKNKEDIDTQLAELPSLRMYYMIDDYDELFGQMKATGNDSHG